MGGKELGGGLRTGEDSGGRMVTSTIPSNTAGKNNKAPWAPFDLRLFLSQKTINPLLGRDPGKSCSWLCVWNQSHHPPP